MLNYKEIESRLHYLQSTTLAAFTHYEIKELESFLNKHEGLRGLDEDDCSALEVLYRNIMYTRRIYDE
jgi:hypothetical protein